NNTAIGNLALQSSVTTSDNVAVGQMAGSGITTANNNIIIGHHSGVHSVFGQESDRCFIDNIHGASVSAATAMTVMVDSDGRLGTGHRKGTCLGWSFAQRHPTPSHSRYCQTSHAQSESSEFAGNGHAATAPNRGPHCAAQRTGRANPESECRARNQ